MSPPELFLDLRGQHGGVGVNTGPKAPIAGIPIPVLPLANCMVLGKSFDLLVSRFSHLCYGKNNNNTYLMEMLR